MPVQPRFKRARNAAEVGTPFARADEGEASETPHLSPLPARGERVFSNPHKNFDKNRIDVLRIKS